MLPYSPLKVFILASLTRLAAGFAVSTTASVSQLLSDHASTISQLKQEASTIVDLGEDSSLSDVFFLRFCLKDYETEQARQEAMQKTLRWRTQGGAGQAICESARDAVQTASSSSQSWNNEPVSKAAPHADIINQYLVPDNVITTSNHHGDLVYCIRAGSIDDEKLMSALGDSAKMVDFFLYCKEVHMLVCNQRSLEQDKLLYVLTANDLSGLKLVGGDGRFRQALSDASKLANELYPTLNGPTVLLNLPTLLGALVKVFKPLFPEQVRKRLKFAQGPLKQVTSLKDVAQGGSQRESFLVELDKLMYQE